MRVIIQGGVMLTTVVGLLACGKSPSQPTGTKETVASLTIGSVQTVTALGQTRRLTATVTASNTTSRDVTNDAEWASLDTSVATVTTGGLVTIVGVGATTISASYQSLTATRSIDALLPATALKLLGNLSLSEIGETTQLQAIATLAGGGTAEVTKYATWITTTDPPVVGVSNGLVTAKSLGWGQVSASYTNRTAAVPLTVTPPGTYVIRGNVKHPGHGVVPGVNVVDTQSGRSTVSGGLGGNGSGWYTLGGLSGNTRLAFNKAGFEPAELIVTGPEINGSGDVKVQQAYRIAAGATVQTTIAPHDVEYNVSPSGPCGDCRLIRVLNPSSGILHLNLTWDLPSAAFSIWTEGQRFTGARPLTVDVPVGAGELILYVGKGSADLNYVTMTLTTGLSASPSAEMSPQARFTNPRKRP